jgi:hypothetical protein
MPYTKATYTYQKTITADPGACKSAENTAKVTQAVLNGTVLSSAGPVTVTACNTKTNALTMGFWQGPNGQKTIGTSSTNGTCTAIISFLGGYAPFTTDMGSKKSCSQLNSYINTLVNSATPRAAGQQC